MSRKTNRDHAKRQQRPMMEDEAIAGQLEVLLSEAITKQRKYCRELGLRVGLSYLWVGSINGVLRILLADSVR